MRVQGVVGTVRGNRAGLHAKRDILAQGGPTRFGAFTAGRVRSLRQHDLLAPNLVRADADQCLAVRTIDGRLPGDRDTEIFTGAGKYRLLERNETAACPVRAADRQIPFGRRFIVNVERERFCDGVFRSLRYVGQVTFRFSAELLPRLLTSSYSTR
jgi:hypothetical protein